MRPGAFVAAVALVCASCTTSGPGLETTTTETSGLPPETIETTTTIAPWVPPSHPIQVDGTGFVDTRTDDTFVPRGANYLTRVKVGNGYQDRTLSPAVFDAAKTEQDFAALQQRGYNTIRVFLDSCCGSPDCIGNPEGQGLNPAYLDIVVEFMELAKAHDLLILFTSNDLPDQGGYWEINDEDNIEGIFPGYRNSHYLTASGELAAKTYWNDLFDGLIERRAPFDAVLGWSALNEQWMFKNEPPLSLTTGEVTTKTGTYDMSDPASKRQMVIDAIRSYFAAFAVIVRQHDPDGLTTSGFFAPQFPNPTGIGGDWYVDTAPLIEDSVLDFFDFHAYPGEDISLTQIAENFGMPADKPVIMGEYGAFRDRFPEIENAALNLQNWVAESCQYGFVGWLYWEFDPADISVGDATWALTADDGYLLDQLAPQTQTDPCIPTLESANLAANATATASTFLEEEPPKNAIDGDPNTQWGAGAGPTQWIEIDLGEPTEIGEIRLVVAQFPNGLTRHLLDVDGERVWAFENDTSDGDMLSFIPDSPISGQVIRITTISSPSWVAWREIDILAP
jgi:hypothetical protein